MLPPVFKRFSDREKVLLMALFAIALTFWSLWFVNRSKAFAKDWERVAHDKAYQSSLLLGAPVIEDALREQLDAIDKTRTLDASHLVGRVDKLARASGLSYELSTPKTTNGDLFDLHNVTLTIRQASMGKLIGFEVSIQEDFPYLSLTSARFTAVPSNPTLLDTTFIITAFELKANNP